MSNVICICGESGSGKTTSLRNLDPLTTFIIDADRKGLSWKGWKSKYNSKNSNFAQTSDIGKIINLLKNVDVKGGRIKTVVIDTLNTVMVDDEIKRMKEKGYDKWQDLAAGVWELVSNSHMLRKNLTVVFVMHTQTERDDSGYYFTRIKTSGKKLDKIVLESKFTTVLITKCVEGKYIFETHANNSTAKSPVGLFDEMEIPNDLNGIIKKLEEYEK